MQPLSWKRRGRSWQARPDRPRAAKWPRPKFRFFHRLGLQGVLAFSLAVLTLLLAQAKSPALRPVSTWLATVLQQDADVGAVQAWYQENIGSAPSFLPAFGDVIGRPVAVPAVGRVTEYQPLLRLSLAPGQALITTAAGQVVAVSFVPEVGHHVVVEYPGGVLLSCEGLAEIKVEKQQFIEAQQPLGTGGKVVTLTARQGGRGVDPSAWITFA